MKKYLCLIFVCSLFAIPVILKAQVDIRNAPISKSPHNLSSWGTGNVRAVSETQICKFCHIAHGASVAPLWGHKLSSATYRLYSSASLKSPRNQPDAGSKLCLSCHDGTVGVGATLKGTIQMTGGVDAQGRLITTSGRLGTDLQTLGANTHFRHPISIAVTGTLISSTAGSAWRLRPLRVVSGKDQIDQYTNAVTSDVYYPLKPTSYTYKGARNSQGTGIQCASCHEPHNNQYGNFMPEPVNFANYSCAHGGTTNGGLCYHCHVTQPPNP